jgi:hypothetical protein
MADVEIRETTVAAPSNGLAVRVQISDAPLNAENAAMLLDLHVTLPAYEAPLLLQVQRQAIVAAMDVLRALEHVLAHEIQGNDPRIDVPLEPKIKQQRTQAR